jgi:hypothetical protein
MAPGSDTSRLLNPVVTATTARACHPLRQQSLKQICYYQTWRHGRFRIFCNVRPECNLPKSLSFEFERGIFLFSPTSFMNRLFLIFPAVLVSFLCGCLNVKTQPIEVKPIHITVNVKVERALDDFFGDLDKKSTTIETPKNSTP